MSSFFICSTACMTRFAFLGSPLMSFPSAAGTICQEKPNLSLSQPHSLSLPPPDVSKNKFGRSEEHTSELQSLTNLVCRLLLEKKKREEKRKRKIENKYLSQTHP